MPIAKPDQARTLRDVPVVIAVLGNDEGSNLSIGGYTLPPAGALVLNPDQSFTYTPAAGFFGTDGFDYTVRDQLGGTAHGEVTIVVARPNSTPTAVNDTASVVIGGSVDVPVLANDNDPEGDPLSHHRRRRPGARHDFGPARPVDPLHAAARLRRYRQLHLHGEAMVPARSARRT